jgi:hypothetical protein
VLTVGRQEAIDDYEEGDSVAAEGDEEWTEEDTWSDPENDADVSDEAQEYLDFLAQQVPPFLLETHLTLVDRGVRCKANGWPR